MNKLDRILFNKLIEEVPAFNYEGISQKTLDRAAALILIIPQIYIKILYQDD